MGGPGSGLTKPAPIPVPGRIWSDDEWDRLRKGAADDEWEASVDGDRLVVAHRIRGKPIYAARLRRELPGWKIVSAEVESDPQAYQPRTPQRESEQLKSVLERLLG